MRRCLDCGQLGQASRCEACRTKKARTYAASPQRRQYHAERYDYQWRKQSKAIREAWVKEYGWLCPGWRRTPHHSTDLVVDHDRGVLCRSCNAVKANTFDRGKGSHPRPPAATQ